MRNIISVALCTYNGEKYIVEQLQSIINQTRKPNEIIICDDSSIDRTVELLKFINFEAIKVKIIVNSTRLGVAKNFEKAIKLCSGDIIFTCDQDDIWEQNKIEKIEEIFTSNETCSLVYTDAILVDQNGKKINTRLWESIDYNNDLLESTEVSKLQFFLRRSVVTGATMAIRGTLVNKAIPIPEHWIHDYWISLIAIMQGDLIGLPEELIRYRQHENNVVGAGKTKLHDKAKIYFWNYKNARNIRVLKGNQMKAFKKFIVDKPLRINKNQEIIINECTKFWSDLSYLSSEDKKGALNIIFKNLINGNYKKYYTGHRGAIRDFLSIFISQN